MSGNLASSVPAGCLPPLQGGMRLGVAYPGFRCAQPRANVCNPSGVFEERSGSPGQPRANVCNPSGVPGQSQIPARRGGGSGLLAAGHGEFLVRFWTFLQRFMLDAPILSPLQGSGHWGDAPSPGLTPWAKSAAPSGLTHRPFGARHRLGFSGDRGSPAGAGSYIAQGFARPRLPAMAHRATASPRPRPRARARARPSPRFPRRSPNRGDGVEYPPTAVPASIILPTRKISAR